MKHTLSRSWPWLLGVIAFGALASIGIFILSRISGRPLSFLTEDPLQTANLPFYTGALSNLGIILWAGTATSSLLAAVLLRRQRRLSLFLTVSGLLTAYLLIDDLFMFHDAFLRYNLHIPEKPTFATYALLFIGYLLYFRKDILSDPYYALLGAGFLFLGSSMIWDALVNYANTETFIEDSLKITGITYWFTYFFTNAVRWVEKYTPVVAQIEAESPTSLSLETVKPVQSL